MDKIIITLMIGIAGGLIGYKTGMPSATLLGAMFAVGIYNIFTGSGVLPAKTSLYTQIVVGSLIGLNFSVENLKSLSKLIGPSILIVLGLLIMSIILGLLLYKLTGIDLVTALFSTCPGGLTSMSLIAGSYGANIQVVVLFHTLRLVAVISLMPIIIKWVLKLSGALQL